MNRRRASVAARLLRRVTRSICAFIGSRMARFASMSVPIASKIGSRRLQRWSNLCRPRRIATNRRAHLSGVMVYSIESRSSAGTSACRVRRKRVARPSKPPNALKLLLGRGLRAHTSETRPSRYLATSARLLGRATRSQGRALSAHVAGRASDCARCVGALHRIRTAILATRPLGVRKPEPRAR